MRVRRGARERERGGGFDDVKSAANKAANIGITKVRAAAEMPAVLLKGTYNAQTTGDIHKFGQTIKSTATRANIVSGLNP